MGGGERRACFVEVWDGVELSVTTLCAAVIVGCVVAGSEEEEDEDNLEDEDASEGEEGAGAGAGAAVPDKKEKKRRRKIGNR